uniref:Uncharacterized protein n=1 Tax=mine drainage metagenome TaxID=410659 RepID=E6QB92_9ZZZZ
MRDAKDTDQRACLHTPLWRGGGTFPGIGIRGWQTRIDAALKEWLETHPPPMRLFMPTCLPLCGRILGLC